MASLTFVALVVALLSLSNLPSPSAAGSCADPVLLRIRDAPAAFDFAVPSGDAGGYYIDALKRSGLMVPVASCILADSLRSLCKAKQPRGVFVDVGAHVGWFSAMAASLGCDVVAIEPQDRAVECIRATVGANAADWRNVSITVVHAAAGSSSGSASLSDSAASSDWALASVTFGSSRQSSSHTVRVVRIDDAVRDALGGDALARVVAVKVDVEGAELDALEGAPLSVASASLVFLEAKRDGLSDAELTQKRVALSQLLPQNVWETHEFFEEIGRKLLPPWGLQWHVLPVRRRQGWAGWPRDRQFDDHVLLRREDKRVALALPLQPRIAFEFPPANFVYPIVERSDSTENGAATLSGSVGVAVYSPDGFTSDHSLSLFIDGVPAMTSPVQPVARGDTYSRLTISLKGWAVDAGGAALYLECGLLFKGEEVASSGPVPVLASPNPSQLHQRDLDPSLWFREIYGGPDAFGSEPGAVA